MTMPRKTRILYENAIYHVYVRGNCKKVIFKDNSDFETFFNICNFALMSYDFLIISYCLMTNHYHLLIQTPNADLPKIMKVINQVYANYFNTKYSEVGYVFQGRYGAKVVEEESYLCNLISYINLNPYEAGLVDDLKNWQWSSYKSIMGFSPKRGFENHDLLWKTIGGKADFENLLKLKVRQKDLLEQNLTRLDCDTNLRLGERNNIKVSECVKMGLSNFEIAERLKMNERSIRRIQKRDRKVPDPRDP
jgi:REP element-mobilizing transposase RayT